jgi:hypothetical protein
MALRYKRFPWATSFGVLEWVISKLLGVAAAFGASFGHIPEPMTIPGGHTVIGYNQRGRMAGADQDCDAAPM